MIEFVPLTGSYTNGTATLRYGLTGNAAEEATLGAELKFFIGGDAQGEVYVAVAPALPASADGSSYLSFISTGFVHIDATVDSMIPLTLRGAPAGFTELIFSVDTESRADTQLEAYGLLMMQPPQIMAYTGLSFASVEEDVVINTGTATELVYQITERVLLQAQLFPTAKLLAEIVERVRMTSHGVPVFLAALEDGFDIGAELTAEAYMVARLADELMIADSSLGLIDALVMVVAAMVLREQLTPIAQGELADMLEFDDETIERVAALVEIAVEMVMAADLEFSAVVFAAVRDSLTIGDDRTALLSALAEVFDNMDFAMRVRIGDEVFVAYAVNIRNTAVTEYSNFPFNAMAFIGGRPFGTSDEGLFRLEGSDDDDTPIDAMVRTGLTEFPELMRGVNAWVVMTNDGEMLFKTITGDEGIYEVATYRMHARPTGTAVETRFDLDKGYVGTAWGFELENVDGAYFELDSARFWPVTVGRRYSGR